MQQHTVHSSQKRMTFYFVGRLTDMQKALCVIFDSTGKPGVFLDCEGC